MISRVTWSQWLSRGSNVLPDLNVNKPCWRVHVIYWCNLWRVVLTPCLSSWALPLALSQSLDFSVWIYKVLQSKPLLFQPKIFEEEIAKKIKQRTSSTLTQVEEQYTYDYIRMEQLWKIHICFNFAVFWTIMTMFTEKPWQVSLKQHEGQRFQPLNRRS